MAFKLNLPYLVPRLIRHFLPEKWVRVLLLKNIIIRPGHETRDPRFAVQRYVDVLSKYKLSLHGKRILVFGYGGRFDMGHGLLERGASHVVLCDKYAPPDEEHNRHMFLNEKKYFVMEPDGLRPRKERMTLLEADIREISKSSAIDPFDIVVSSSVYEHLDDVEGITASLAALTKLDGVHIHFVDLRDHYFKYPFEMLRYSEKTWRNWLNPSSNHNRYRLWNYRNIFQRFFRDVDIEILAREHEAFRKVQNYIRPEFLSGDPEDDSVTLIRVFAFGPLSQ